MSDHSFDVGPSARVSVRVERGSIVLVPGGEGRIVVEVAGPGGDDLIVDGGPSGVTIRPPGRLLRAGGKADVRVTVPPDTHADLALASGAIDVRAPVAGLQVSAASGDVSAAALPGRAVVKTASGDVTIGSADGDLAVTSGSGDLRVGRLTGHGRVTTASGDLLIGDLDGDLTCKTASGDVSVRRFRAGTLTFRTVSGDTTIGIPPGRRVTYDVEAVSGRLRLPDPAAAPSPPPPGNGPKPVVRVEGRSVSGDTTFQHATLQD